MAKVKVFDTQVLSQRREYAAHSGPMLLASFLAALTGGDVSTPEQAAVLVERTLSYEVGSHTRVVDPGAPRVSLPLPTKNWQKEGSVELLDADAVLRPIWVEAGTRIDNLQYAHAHAELAGNGWLSIVDDTGDYPQYHLSQTAHNFKDTLYGLLRVVRAYLDALEDEQYANKAEVTSEAAVMRGILEEHRKAAARGAGGLNMALNNHMGQLPLWTKFDRDQHARRTAQTFGQSYRAV